MKRRIRALRRRIAASFQRASLNAAADAAAIRARLSAAAAAVSAWRATLDDFERPFYAGLVLAALGLALERPSLAFIVPGTALAAVAVTLRLRGR